MIALPIQLHAAAVSYWLKAGEVWDLLSHSCAKGRMNGAPGQVWVLAFPLMRKERA
jgi:hypothetical protein